MASQKQGLLLKNIKQLVRISNSNEKYKIGSQMTELAIEQDTSILTSPDGKILAIGAYSTLLETYPTLTTIPTIDCSARVVLPGLIDSHTHAVFAGDRVHEFVMKLQGKTYMEIHEQGGGIGFTVRHVRKASEDELLQGLEQRLKAMSRVGTTLCEIKSGYGLDTESEIKMLRVIEKAAKKHQFIDIVANYCGGHSVPEGMDQWKAKDIIIKEALPKIQELKQKGEINPEFIDVFCEKGVFEREATKEILIAGKKAGLRANFHGDELTFIDSGTLGAECEAIAISHLENLDSAGIKAMAANKVAGVLLPTTHYLLKLKNPPTREMIQEGVIVALGSDFNPNAYCYSMPFTMNLACVNYKMTPSEALVAATLNAAASINRSETHGSIEIGKVADFVILDAPSWEYIIYQFGDSPIEIVIKNGEKVYQKQPN